MGGGRRSPARRLVDALKALRAHDVGQLDLLRDAYLRQETMPEIAEALGVSTEEVRRRHVEALRSLRAADLGASNGDEDRVDRGTEGRVQRACFRFEEAAAASGEERAAAADRLVEALIAASLDGAPRTMRAGLESDLRSMREEDPGLADLVETVRRLAAG